MTARRPRRRGWGGTTAAGWRATTACSSRPTPASSRSAAAAADVDNLLTLAGWEVVKRQARVLAPAPALGLDRLANRYLAPLLGWLCLTTFTVARPAPSRSAVKRARSVSVIVPARNESGNV